MCYYSCYWYDYRVRDVVFCVCVLLCGLVCFVGGCLMCVLFIVLLIVFVVCGVVFSCLCLLIVCVCCVCVLLGCRLSCFGA